MSEPMAICRKDVNLRHPVGQCPYDDKPPTAPDRFEDERGVIHDILAGPIDQVTEIRTVAGAVRGNHTHNETVQWTYVVSGLIRMVQRSPAGYADDDTYGPGALIRDEPGWAHAWQAEKDTTVLVFTRGPRSGANYESDTQRLAPEDRLL